MNFEFSRNSQGFESCGDVEVRRINHEGEPSLVCRCRESGDSIGLVKDIKLSNANGGQYQLKVTGYANNNRTYLIVTDNTGYPLTSNNNDQREFFKNKKRTTLSVSFYARTTNIRIGILMGGDSIAVPDNYFVLYQVKLIPVNIEDILDSDNKLASSRGLKITRVFETIIELTREGEDPLRSDGKTSMKVGEYAILKGGNGSGSGSGSGNQDDLYILSNSGLKYVSRIGNGLPSFFGQISLPGKVLPVYGDHNEAMLDLTNNPDKFYEPRGNYEWSNGRNQIQGDIFIYLDDSGYVRWLRHSTSK